MNGLLYKNLRNNRLYFLCAALVPFGAMILVCLLLCISDKNSDPLEGNDMIIALYMCSTFFALSLSHSNTIAVDERKKWAYFIVSSPKGVKGQVLSRYVVVVLLSVISFFSALIGDLVYVAVGKALFGKRADLNWKFLAVVLVILIFLNAVELPFLFRFGSKRGSTVKLGVFIALLIIAGIYFLFGPMPNSFDNMVDKLMGFIDDIIHGHIPQSIKNAFYIFSGVSVVLLVISYMISCRLYLKGIENFDE